MCKAAGRPWPVICPDDDVLDYMVMEAVALRVQKADEDAQKKAKVDDWKKKAGSELSKFA